MRGVNHNGESKFSRNDMITSTKDSKSLWEKVMLARWIGRLTACMDAQQWVKVIA